MFCAGRFATGEFVKPTNTVDLHVQAALHSGSFLAGLNYFNVWNDSNPIMIVGQRTLGEIRRQKRRGAKDHALRCQVNPMLRRGSSI
jgi:hypothetical protein